MGKDAFSRWTVPPDAPLNGFFRAGQSRCEIYILEFADGDRYVGQAVDVVRRFADHRRHYEDIVGIQFRAVPRGYLNSAERQTVHDNEARGYRLRNTRLVNLSWAPSPLDIEIDRPMQESWITDGIHDGADDPRTLRALRRLRTRDRYLELCDHPMSGEIFSDLVTFVETAIIWPSATIEERWTITALPSTRRTRYIRRLVTVNCGMVEAFVILEDRTDDSVYWFLNVDPSAFRPEELRPDLRGTYTHVDNYRSVGRVGRIENGAAGTLASWFEETPSLAPAARTLALGLMRKSPAMFARAHCDDLGDDVLAALADSRAAEHAAAP